MLVTMIFSFTQVFYPIRTRIILVAILNVLFANAYNSVNPSPCTSVCLCGKAASGLETRYVNSIGTKRKE